MFLDERITQEEFEKDLVGEVATAERSEVMGDEETREAETQVLGEMDMDSGEDEVVMVVTQKQVLSLPTKTVWKRAHATAGSQEMVVAAVINQNVSVATCEQCLWQGVACIRTRDGARCVSCCNKHMRCSFIMAKDGEGKGTSLGMQCMKSLARPQTKGTSMDAPEVRGVDCLSGIKSGMSLVPFYFLFLMVVKEPGHCKLVKQIHKAISTGTQFRTCGGICCSIDTLHWCLEAYDTKMDSICLEKAVCKALIKELEEALKGEPSTDEEEMARELAEDVQR